MTCLRPAQAIAAARCLPRCTGISTWMVVPLSGALSMMQVPPSELHSFGHGGETEALRRGGRRCPCRRRSSVRRSVGAARLAAVTRGARFLDEIDGEVARLAVADGVGDAFLDAAIEREVDRLAVGFGEPSAE